jgi:glycosyltransferase involved in cell wall biosynthesis
VSGTSRLIACTIVARNYLAQAEVLARSFAKYHPDIDFVTLVIDGLDDDRDHAGVGRVMLTSELGLDRALVNRMSVLYDVMEYATALKPALLMSLLREGASAIAYIDPDIRFFAPIHDIFAEAVEHGIVVTPHTLEPMPRDGKNHSEMVIMQAGMFNLGFIAVGGAAYRFLVWWHERLQTDAISDVSRGLFTDQRWVDWVPSVFGNFISKDPGLNVAYWNLHERPISLRDGTFFASNSPLRFFHFSGYDPRRPLILSRHLGDRPRVLLSENPHLLALVDDYANELNAAGHLKRSCSPYLLGKLPNGIELTSVYRRIYRALVVGEIPTVTPIPDPIDSVDAFIAWMFDPASLGPHSTLSPLELGLWFQRTELRAAFPDIHGGDNRHYRRWLDQSPEGIKTMRAMGAARPERTKRKVRVPAPSRVRHPFGWSTIAYATSEHGVGEAGRRMANAIARVGLPTDLVAVPGGTISRQEHRLSSQVHSEPGYENAVVCVNADQLPRVAAVTGLDRLRGRKVGLWFWELEEFPRDFGAAFDHVHEVWTTSEFTRRAVQATTSKPVRVVPLEMPIPSAATNYTRRSLGLPEHRYLFLTNFDYLSVVERKNPIATIRAYRAAFGPDDGAVLVVKSINGNLRQLDSEGVRLAAGGRADIVFIDNYVTASEMKAMIELSDCFVSLHRSEGFGLNLADAMTRGTPVIATAYSGNLDFMTNEVATLIPYGLTTVGPYCAPYDPSSVWAEPDVAAAAAAMRTLFDSPSSGIAQANRARRFVAEHFSPDVVAATMLPLLIPAAAIPTGRKR